MQHYHINNSSSIFNTIKKGRIGLGCANFGGIGSDPKLIGKGASEKDSFNILDIALKNSMQI